MILYLFFTRKMINLMAKYADGTVVPTGSVAQYPGLEDGVMNTLHYVTIECSGQEVLSKLTFFVHKLLGNGNFKIATER